MEAQTDQATPEYLAADGDRRAFNKFYKALCEREGVRNPLRRAMPFMHALPGVPHMCPLLSLPSSHTHHCRQESCTNRCRCRPPSHIQCTSTLRIVRERERESGSDLYGRLAVTCTRGRQ